MSAHHGAASRRLDLGGDLLGRRRIGALAADVAAQIVDDHGRALGGQKQRVAAAEPPPGARHDRHPVR